MRILIAHGRYRSLAPSGENIVVDQEGAALRAAGHEVLHFERHSDDITGWSPVRKATLPAVVLWNTEVRRDLAARIAAARPDIVHIHNTFPLLSPAVLYACREAGVPAVVTLHNYRLLCARGDFFRDGQPCHDCATGRGAPGVLHGCYRGSHLATLPVVAANSVHRSAWNRLVSAYIFISASQRDLMSPMAFPPERVFVKHNFVVSAQPPSPVREHVVTFVGRLDVAKGVPLLMQAWDAFRAQNPVSALRLVIVGSGPMEAEVRAWAAHQASVHVVGLLPREGALELLGRSVASVITSQSEETFGLVAVESMAAGVAPIAPSRGPFPELIRHGADGVLFEAADPRSLASALVEVDRDPTRFVQMGCQSRSTYELRFRPEPSIERLVDIYRFAVANPIGGGTRAASTMA